MTSGTKRNPGPPKVSGNLQNSTNLLIGPDPLRIADV